MRNINLYILISCLAVCLAGCKVYSFTGASISPDIKTVTIAVFPNQATLVQPSLSQVFTEKLKDKFVSQTNLTQTQYGGDLQFEGAITDYFSMPTAIQGNEQAALNRLTIVVKVKFTNTKDEKQSFETSFSRFTDYDSRKNLTSIEQELINEVCNQLVDDIFNKAVINW
ncbi:MAG TPA: LptE family protein [Bacteroidia bacterium]|nr:LptE family protein [Bacteroidia bacterium]